LLRVAFGIDDPASASPNYFGVEVQDIDAVGVYKAVFNFVDVRNTKTLKWLKYLGFKQMETVENYGHAKRPFVLIVKEIQ